jgi:hypothetical protein
VKACATGASRNVGGPIEPLHVDFKDHLDHFDGHVGMANAFPEHEK